MRRSCGDVRMERMGPVAKSVAYGCSLALKWILLITAGLLLILVVVQYFRGDATANPQSNLIVMTAFAVAGAVCHYICKKIADS